ncbi:hypothetical protein [Kocuria sp.]|uniref:hypothetical protein n=1 Tax=Kocuria sp. TaxID=1871328 RepID=UPI0026E01DE0|nr:hypothetical protein [Kocuria sp.]MDO5619236.1 hypothetical protein [Kocuria sp.]
MTPLSRDLHPSNGHRAPAISDDVVVPISAAFRTAGHARRQAQEPTGNAEAPETGQPMDVTALPTEDDPDQDFPTEVHWVILELLSIGCTDDIIAHRLNLDMCTYRGLLGELTTHLGACNRFQLALKAREQGWV